MAARWSADVNEPTEEQSRNIRSLQQLLEWAGVPGNVHHPGSPAGALVRLAGLIAPTETEWTNSPEGAFHPHTSLAEVNWALLRAFANSDADEWKEETANCWTYAVMASCSRATIPDA